MEKSKRALITRLINRFVSNGTKSLASSLCAISSFIFATRVIIEQGEKYQLVSQDFDETANWIYERNWQQTYRSSDKEKENIREEEANGKMFDDFRTSYFSRHFNKLLLCSTILPLQLRHVQSSRERRKKQDRGTRPICESVLHKIARVLGVCLCVRKSGTRKHLKAWIPLGRRGERNTANQLANCCPLLESTTSKRFSRTSTVIHLSFPLQLCWTRRDSLEAISSKINRNGYDTRFPGTARRFPRGRPPPWCWKRSMERCQLLDSQGSGSLIVAGN